MNLIWILTVILSALGISVDLKNIKRRLISNGIEPNIYNLIRFRQGLNNESLFMLIKILIPGYNIFSVLKAHIEYENLSDGVFNKALDCKSLIDLKHLDSSEGYRIKGSIKFGLSIRENGDVKIEGSSKPKEISRQEQIEFLQGKKKDLLGINDKQNEEPGHQHTLK